MSRTREKIKELEVMVADVIQEAPDTATLVFFTGNDKYVLRTDFYTPVLP